MEGCIFCRIVAGEAPAHVVCEDALTIAFMDHRPLGEGHLLVVPKAHARDLFEAEPEAWVRVMAQARRLALAQRAVLAPDGVALHQLNGAAAGQTVFHYHVHVIPRWRGDPVGLHGSREAAPERLAELARRLAAALPPELG